MTEEKKVEQEQPEIAKQISKDDVKVEVFLIPVEERQVEFYGDEITAALVEIEKKREVYVPVRPLCDYLGLSWAGQRERINRDEVLRDVLASVRVTRTEAGGKRDTLCLPLKFLPGWLFGIDASRVKPGLKEKITRYRRECYDVLYQAFQNEAIDVASLAHAVAAGAIENLDDLDMDYEAGIDERLAAREPTEGQLALLQIREMGLSIARLADQQLEIERKADRANERLDAAREYLMRLQTRFDQRITALEDRLTPPADYITEDQVAQLQLEVKALAGLLTSQDQADKRKNHYQGIFNELYRRFGVSSYTHIRLGQYANVRQFLADWKHAADNNISTDVFLQGKLF
ncbi:MAG TPA: phage antirepressor N-terminal domain-containing protein [Chloroflexia bacterium]|nr:phage antirepressor N-terminal domain-containing protein [Chloroflexia bacterium]